MKKINHWLQYWLHGVYSIGLLYFLMFIFGQTSVFAATGINEQIHFQGKVVNTDGTNVANNDYDFIFKIYTVDTGGSPIWTESRTGVNQVTVTDGVFSVNLGSITTLPGSVDFNTDNIYLGIEFNNDGEMDPRVLFTAVPYALNSAQVGGLTVTDTTSTLTIPSGIIVSFSGTNNTTFTTTDSTNVTLPTTGTLATLAGIETFTNKTIGSTGLTFSGATTDITTGANEDLVIIPNGTGNVGIGTTSPENLLELESLADTIVRLQSAASGVSEIRLFEDIENWGGAINYQGNGNYLQIGTYANGPFIPAIQIARGSSNVGIGTNNPVYTLDVVGELNLTDAIRVAGDAGTSGYLLTSSAGGANTWTDPSTLGTSLWANTLNVFHPKNEFAGVVDLAIGGVATGSAGILIQSDGDIIATGSILGSSFDRSSAGALTIGNATATTVSICNSTDCDTILIGNNADADTITIGDLNDSLTLASTGLNVSSAGAVSGVSTFSSSGDWTSTATTPSITINSGEVFTITDGTDSFVINTTQSKFTFLDGLSNGFEFDADTGVLLSGSARPKRRDKIVPEFPGAVLTGDGGSNTGTMTSDFCEFGASSDIPDTNTSVCNTSGDIHNYYSWTTNQGTAQDYDIWVRWRLPDNVGGWDTNPIQIFAKRTDATNNAVTVYVYDTNGVLNNAGGTQVAGTSWTQTNISVSGGTWTAGSYITFRIVMTADTGGDSVQVGEINLNYLSNN